MVLMATERRPSSAQSCGRKKGALLLPLLYACTQTVGAFHTPARQSTAFLPHQLHSQQFNSRNVARARGELRCQVGTAAERLQKNEPVLREVATRLQQVGLGKAQLVQDRSLGPGLSSSHYRFVTNEATIFVKLSARPGAIYMFEEEHRSLTALAATQTLRVPTPYSFGLLSDGVHSYLAMEEMESVPFGPAFKSVAGQLGHDLARLHLHPVPFMGRHYGFQSDNFLGLTPLKNDWADDLATFFIQNRLLPQLVAAGERFDLAKWNHESVGGSGGQGNVWYEVLLDRVTEILRPVALAKPSLLHGELWQGNTGALKVGRKAWAHDPACWYGHSEFDLALSGLFGGFLPEFYEAYHSLIPKAEGFEARQEVYKLFFHLYHLNTHGAGFGTGGTARDPRGYYERVLNSMRRICQQ